MTEGGTNTGFPTVKVSNTYNNRLQPVILSATGPGGTIMSHTLCYAQVNCPAVAANDGNILMDVNSMTSALTATYTYDTLGRLSSSKAVAWSDATSTSFGSVGLLQSLRASRGEVRRLPQETLL